MGLQNGSMLVCGMQIVTQKVSINYVSESHRKLCHKFGLLSMIANCAWLVTYNCGVLIIVSQLRGSCNIFWGYCLANYCPSFCRTTEHFVDYSQPLLTNVKCLKLTNLESCIFLDIFIERSLLFIGFYPVLLD